MKFPKLFSSTDPIVAADAEITGRTRRIATLRAEIEAARGRIAGLSAKHDEAFAKGLDAGQSAEEAGAVERAAVANAQALLATMESHLDRETAALDKDQARRDAMKAMAEREEAATSIETRADAVVEAARSLDAPIAALGKALGPLLDAIKGSYGPRAKAEDVAAAIVAEALAHRVPQLFAFVNAGEGNAVIAGSGLVRATVSSTGTTSRIGVALKADPLSAADFARTVTATHRERAASIRAGTVDMPKPAPVSRPVEPDFRFPTDQLLTVVVTAFAYTELNGDVAVVQAGQSTQRRVVADEAIKRGLAHRAHTTAAIRAAARMAAENEGDAPVVLAARQVEHIGIDIRAMEAAYVAEKRKAWQRVNGVAQQAA